MKTTNASANAIHPTALIHPSAEIGSGVTVAEYATIGAGVKLRNGAHVGARSVVEDSSQIGEHATVGNDTTIRSGVVIDAHGSVGDRCSIGEEDLDDRSQARRRMQPLRVGHARIDDDCRIEGSLHIGDMAQIQEGSRIEADGYIGQNGIVGENVRIGPERQPGSCQLRMEARTSIGTGADLAKATRIDLNPDAEIGDHVRATGDLKVESRAGIGNRAEVSHLTVRYDQQVPADAQVSGRRCPRRFDEGANRRQGGIHPTARIGAGVSMGEDVSIGAHAEIEAGATLLDGCDIRAHAQIGRGCDIGRNAVVLDHAVIEKGANVEDNAAVEAGRRVRDGENVQRNERPAHAYGTRAAEGWPNVAGTAHIHPTARVDPSATVCDGARIGPNTTVGPGCRVGERATLNAATLGAGARVNDGATVLESTIEDRAEIGANAWVECAYVCQGAYIGGDQREADNGAKRAHVVGDASEILHKKNGTRVPPTPDEAGIVVGAEACVTGDGRVEGRGAIGDGKRVELDPVTRNALTDATTTRAGTEAARRREHGMTYRPAEGPGAEPSCTPRAWRSFQHLEDVALDTAPDAPAQPREAAGAAAHTRERKHEDPGPGRSVTTGTATSSREDDDADRQCGDVDGAHARNRADGRRSDMAPAPSHQVRA